MTDSRASDDNEDAHKSSTDVHRTKQHDLLKPNLLLAQSRLDWNRINLSNRIHQRFRVGGRYIDIILYFTRQ